MLNIVSYTVWSDEPEFNQQSTEHPELGTLSVADESEVFMSRKKLILTHKRPITGKAAVAEFKAGW